MFPFHLSETNISGSSVITHRNTAPHRRHPSTRPRTTGGTQGPRCARVDREPRPATDLGQTYA
eukprot:3556037-Pleurochrysis_carterae.AAC.2